MLIIDAISLLRQHIYHLKQKNKKIALVPTMGNLHDGHVELINKVKIYADTIIVTIFVNPMQFNCIEDLSRYPRTLQEDYKKLNKLQIDFIFSPLPSDIYPQDVEKSTYVEVPPSTSIIFDNISHQKHFRGVLTIVSKLFNLIQPNIACFGEKDYIQLMLVRKLVTDMGYNIKIISVPIVRSEDGLALSSRNNYLTIEQRKIAPNIYKIMNTVAENLVSERFNIEEIIILAQQKLNNVGFYKNSVQIIDADNLLALTKTSERAVILVTAWLGNTRLIDNKIVNLKKKIY